MNRPTSDHLFTTKNLISTFFRESECELSRLAQGLSTDSETCGVSNVAETDWFINQTSELLSSLRTLRNSLVPVNRIPPEIITSIISYRVAPIPDIVQYQVLSTPTSVCRYWRNAICSFPSFWTTMSDVYHPQLRRIILERSKAALLHVFRLRPSDDFMEGIGAHTTRIKTLQCKVTFGGGLDEPFDREGNPNQMISDFKTSSDALEMLCLSRNGISDISETVRFGIVPNNPKALRTLQLRYMPLTIQFTQLTTLTNFSYFNPHVRSELLLDFLKANTLLEDVTIHCMNISDSPNHVVVPLDHLRQLSLNMGQTVQNLLQCLRLPSASRIDLFLNRLADGKLLWELLPTSLHALPGIANTTLLHCKFTTEFHLIVIGSNPAGGMITVRGHPTQLFAGKPVNLGPLNLGTVREFVLSSRTKPFASTWSRLRQAVQEMSGVETLVVGGRVTLRDLPEVLMNEELLPNLSAITLITPSLDEIASFVSSVLVRNGNRTLDAKRIEFLEILCSRYEEDFLTEAVKRPLEGYVGLVEVRVVQDADDVWVKSIKRTIDRDGFFR
ncbi:hypothetical protein BDM02DRAFT_3220430 [Thelephora ganbajun]|uniref:Uncharacterized protein n=1 Tax=Thelephora ganbajun TaxID=370292 RepID=A0ACB6ZLW1_THEGA|nr:hypothetical protein BDM02DRAFT_3220430 [Thelephora ganbajun]